MERNKTIETLRGITIVLIIIEHVIGSTPEGGMRIEFPSFARYWYLHSNFIVMALFAAISGWAYARTAGYNTSFITFTKRKFIRLIIPLITVGTTYFLLQYFTPGTNIKGELSSIWRIYIFPYTLYWFLPSIFLLLLFQFIIDKLHWCNTLKAYGILLLLAFTARFAVYTNQFDWLPNVFSIHGAMSRSPYFLVGVGVYRFANLLDTSKLKYIGITGLILSIILLQFVWFYNLGIKETIAYYIAQPLFTSGILIWLLTRKFSLSTFANIGTFSYGIYLFHGFGTSGGRIILSWLNVQNEIIVFIIAFILALASSIAVTWILKKNKITALLFLGERIKK